MSKTLFVEFRGRGFWAFDVVSGVFLKHLVDAATSSLAYQNQPWLADAVGQWRFNAVISDCGLFLDDAWSAEQVQVFGELALASAILAVAEVRCDEAVEGAQVALEALGSARRDLQDSMSRFDAQRRDVASDPQVMVALGSAGRREIIALQRDMLAVDRQLEGALGRLARQVREEPAEGRTGQEDHHRGRHPVG